MGFLWLFKRSVDVQMTLVNMKLMLSLILSRAIPDFARVQQTILTNLSFLGFFLWSR